MDETFKLCRLCLVPEEKEKFQSLFDVKGNYIEKIREVSGLNICKSEAGQLICSNCILELNSFCRFRLQILDADDYFKAISSEVKGFSYQDESVVKTPSLEDFEQTIPADKISKNIKNETLEIKRAAKKRRKSMPKGTPKAETHVEKAVKFEVEKDETSSQSSSDLNIQPLVVLAKPKIEMKLETIEEEIGETESVTTAPITIPIPTALIMTPIPTAPITTPTESNKRIRKPSSKLRESREPAALLIKQMHSLIPEKKKPKADQNKSQPRSQPKKRKLSEPLATESDICHKTFTQNNDLVEHLATHKAEDSFKCFFCSEEFKEYSFRIIHMQKQHSNKLQTLYTMKQPLQVKTKTRRQKK